MMAKGVQLLFIAIRTNFYFRHISIKGYKLVMDEVLSQLASK